MTKSLLTTTIQSLSQTNAESKVQILIVEDENIIALNLKENLESLGYAVVAIAASGEKAVEQATTLYPDLVLMDIWLKGDMDGIQAAQKIWDNLSIPVIYMTGHSDQSTLERAKVTAPFGYILKPIKERELYVAIETARERYEREQLLSAVLKGMGDGVIMIDTKHRVQFLNKVAQSLTGWEQDEAIEKEWTEVFNIINEQTQQPVDNPVTATLQQETTVYLEDYTLLISKNGTTIPLGGSAASIKNKKGAIAGTVLVFRDITSSRQLEKAKLELEQTLDELKHTQAQLILCEKMSSIGQMAAAVVNEINNPVSIIYGNLPLARQYFQDLLSVLESYKHTDSNATSKIEHLAEKIDLDFLVEDWPQLMNSMQVAAERIQEIVLSLLSLCRVPQQDKLDLKPVDIHEGIDNTLRILRHRLKAEGKRPEIQVIKDYGQLPKVTCYASQLNQVFMHLLSNAIDALETRNSPRIITIHTEVVKAQETVVSETKQQTTGSGGRSRQVSDLSCGEKEKLQAFQHPSTKHEDNPNSKIQNPKSNDWIFIQIADNGCGMSEEVLAQIFDPFFTTKPIGYGTGLGLSISYQIVVDKHGGQLLCHSIPGQGTEFAIYVPIQCY